VKRWSIYDQHETEVSQLFKADHPGVAGAVKLGSEMRFKEALFAYKQMRCIWPHEPQVKELAELFLR